MRFVQIPGTDLTPSGLCLGAGNFGTSIDRGASFALLDAFVDQAGNFIDTAKVYGDWVPGEKSASEKAIGRWLEERKNRMNIVLGTKGGHPDLAAMDIARLSPQDIASDLEASLHNLRTDFIDLYWMHRDDVTRPVEDIIDTLLTQMKAGKLRAFGCSNWKIERILAAQAYAARIQARGFVANQLMWSLAEVDPENLFDATQAVMTRPTYEYHQSTNLVAIPYSAQAQGWFQRAAHGTETSMSANQRKMYETPVNRQRAERAQQVARECGLSVSQIVLGYMAGQPFPVIPILGCKNHEQLRDSLRAADVVLSGEQIAFLEG